MKYILKMRGGCYWTGKTAPYTCGWDSMSPENARRLNKPPTDLAYYTFKDLFHLVEIIKVDE